MKSSALRLFITPLVWRNPLERSDATPPSPPCIDQESISRHSVSLDERESTKSKLNPITLDKLLCRIIKEDGTPAVAGKKRRTEDVDARKGPSAISDRGDTRFRRL